MHFLLWAKDPIKNSTLALSSALVKIYKIPPVIFDMLVFLQILHHSSVSCKITPLYFFRSNIHKRKQSKFKFLRLSSARVKIQQILVIWETAN